MRRFVIEIDLKNAAFAEDEGGEVARILTSIAGTIRNHGVVFDMPIQDVNGNHCGDAIVEDTEPLT